MHRVCLILIVTVLLCGCKQRGPNRAATVVPAAPPPAGVTTPSATMPAVATTPAQTPRSLPAMASATPQPRSTPLPQPDQNLIFDLSFVDPNQGWATGEICAHGGPQCRPVLWHTADGGRIWREGVTPDRLVTYQAHQDYPDAPQVLFTTPKDGWLYGLKLYVTHDGGATWAEAPMPGEVESLTYADGEAWAIAGVPCLVWRLTGCTRKRLLASDDLGRSWHPATGWPGLTGSGLSFLRLSGGRAWAVGDRAIATHNGGKSWQPFAVPEHCTPHGSDWEVMSGDPAGQFWLICAGAPGGGEEGRSVYRSPDDGSSWTRVYGPTAAGYAHHLVAISNKTAFLCGSRIPLLRTDDGGRTWPAAIVPSGGDWSCPALSFVDAQHGWFAVGGDYPYGWNGAIWRTEDGGVHWQRVGLP